MALLVCGRTQRRAMEVIRVEHVGTRRRGRVSAADVARAAGVSAAAVSYVMNGRPGVSADTRTHVLEVAERLGHVPTERIAGLRQQRTRVIGLVLTDIANPFYTEIGAGVIDAARARGYEVFLAHTQEDRDTLQAVVDAMVARQVDGIILTVLHPEDGRWCVASAVPTSRSSSSPGGSSGSVRTSSASTTPPPRPRSWSTCSVTATRTSRPSAAPATPAHPPPARRPSSAPPRPTASRPPVPAGSAPI
jgi:transcriptional regulator with XRE-family HTH domain